MNENKIHLYTRIDMNAYLTFFFWIILIFSGFTFSLPVSSQTLNAMGCDFENVDTSKTVKALFPGQRGSLPARFSLRNYAPMPGHQGSVGSCAAWASAYAGLTIMNGVEAKGKQRAFSPWHLYNRVQTSLNRQPCQNGSTISSALNMLKSNGCLHFDDYSADCGTEPAVQDYPFDLYDYQALSISVTDFKKALASEQPIIAAFKAYNNTGWEIKENIMDGVWNGKHTGESVGGHAMCIIGYDDQKNGGAFEVINSWGTQWGQGGFFWIRYQDITANIKNAFSLIPHPEQETTLASNVYAQQLEIHNDCYDPIYVAIGMEQEGEWVSKGWYPVLSNDLYTIDVSSRTSNEIQWTAANHDMSIQWENAEASIKLCTDMNQSFEFTTQDCPNPIGFNSAQPKPQQSKYILHLGCPTLQGRNAEVIHLADHNEVMEDPRSKVEANQFWKSEYALYDLLSQHLIPAYMNDEGENVYSVWITDGTQAPEKKDLTPEEMEMDHRFKFISEQTAQQWLQWKKEKK